MQTYDIIMLAVLVGTTLFGAVKGLAWQVAAASSIVVSYVVAYKFRDVLAVYLPLDAPLNVFAAMLILYLGTSLAIWIGFRFVSGMINRVKLKEFDRQAGALLGLGSGIALCLIITFFAVTLMGEQQRKQICESRSGQYIAKVIDRVHPIMPEEIHDLLGPYLHSLDDRLHEHQSDHQPSEHPSDRDLPDRRDFTLNIDDRNINDRNIDDRDRDGTPVGGRQPQSNTDSPDFKIRFGDTDYGIRLRRPK